EGADPISRRDDDVVGPADEPEIAVLVAAGTVACQVPLAAPASGASFRILPVLEEQRRRPPAQREVTHLARVELAAVVADDAPVVPRERLAHGAGTDGERRQVR